MKLIISKLITLLLFAVFVSSNANAISNLFKSKINSNAKVSDSSFVSDSAYAKALRDFNNASKAEKKARIKEVKRVLKEYKKKKKKKNGGDVSTNDILMAILCILLPPLAVYLHQGKEINDKFWISCLLTILFWLPGVIYALLVVFVGI